MSFRNPQFFTLNFSLLTSLSRTLLLLAMAWAVPCSVAESSFTGLGFLPGYTGRCDSVAYAVSGDGSVVVGGCSKSSDYNANERLFEEAFRWTAADGMVGLGNLRRESFRVALARHAKRNDPLSFTHSSCARAVSSNGKVVVGQSGAGAGVDEAFRWTSDKGMTGLGHLARGRKWSLALGVSNNGGVVVGYGDWASGYQAFRMGVGTGMIGLGFLPGGVSSYASAVSGDGKVIVGHSQSDTRAKAFRWTAATGKVGLGCLRGYTDSYAGQVAADGSVIAGECHTNSEGEVFRWTVSGGMVGLGRLRGYNKSHARGLSGDGSVVVGSCSSASEEAPFIWDSVNGMRNLQSVLSTDYKLDLHDWKNLRAYGLSFDGRTIVGSGYHNGQREAWMAYLDRPEKR